MKRSNSLILTLLIVFISFNAFAKKGDKVPGYIILNGGEKVEGKIVIGSITDNETKVNFIKQGERKKKSYKPKQLEGYAYQEVDLDDVGKEVKRWVHFDRMKVDYPPKIFASTTVFVEREIEGEISLYCYYVEVRNDPKKPYRYYYYLKDIDGEVTKVERDNFEKMSKSTFKSYTALTSRLGKKDFQYRNLDRMVRDYNYWTANQHDPDEYRVAMKED